MGKQSSLDKQIVFFFAEELWYEILSWLGVKSLLRCKSVCKIWYDVIKNKHFVEMHAIRNRHKICKINDRSKLRNSDGTEEEFMHLSDSCRGLLAVKKLAFASATRLYIVAAYATYQISNPATKCVLDLPCPHQTVETMYIFLNSSTSSYNVVSVYRDQKNNRKLELIDLGGQSNDTCPDADLSWRTLNISEFDNFNREKRYCFRYCMSSEGVFYILALQTDQPSNHKIICADLVKQTCTTLSAPQSLCFEWHVVWFLLWRGQPTLKVTSKGKLNFWILEDYKKQKWADPIVIPVSFLEQNPLIYEFDEEECVVYQKDNPSHSVYNHLVSNDFWHAGVPATLVSVKGMQWRRMKPGTRYIKFRRQKHVLVKKEFV